MERARAVIESKMAKGIKANVSPRPAEAANTAPILAAEGNNNAV